MSRSPSELSDDALVAIIQASQTTVRRTKLPTEEVFNRLSKFNNIFLSLETKPDQPALIYRDPRCGSTQWKPIGSRLLVGRGPKVGAGPQGALLAVDDPEMSRHHFEIVRGDDGVYAITDLHSTNGLFINGSKAESGLLIDGAEIRAGWTQFFFSGT